MFLVGGHQRLRAAILTRKLQAGEKLPSRPARRLLRIFFMSAQVSIQFDPQSKAFYQRKRDEGKKHNAAVLALARRRVTVLWACVGDGQPYDPDGSARAGLVAAA